MRVSVALLTVACGGGTWEVSVSGAGGVEDAIPVSSFADGCSVSFSAVNVVFTSIALQDVDSPIAEALAGPAVWELTEPGPHRVTVLDAPAGHYDRVQVSVAPAAGAELNGLDSYDEAASVGMAGTLSGPDSTVAFDWRFALDQTWLCEPADLTLPPGGADSTVVTVFGDHLFYDGLANADAALRGLPILAADADADGTVTLDELAAVDLAPLGYHVGGRTDVITLRDHVEALAAQIVHLDGATECLPR